MVQVLRKNCVAVEKSLHGAVQFVAQKQGNCTRRSLESSQTAVVGGIANRRQQQILVFVHGRHYAHQHQQKHAVALFRGSRFKEILPLKGKQRPVVVFTASVHPVEGFFMEQTHKTVFFCHAFQYLHYQLILVARHVYGSVAGGKFKLTGRNFPVFRFDDNSQTLQFCVHVMPKLQNFFVGKAIVVVVQLLCFGRKRPKQRFSRHYKVGTVQKHLFVNQKVFLFRTYNAAYRKAFHSRKTKQSHGLFVQRIATAQ
ncbi:unknown [Corallococcus sp. CAG:1435]|nr:unknown [Corallococcus sp. CAG:1435]